jgi:hypothetical protein
MQSAFRDTKVPIELDKVVFVTQSRRLSHPTRLRQRYARPTRKDVGWRPSSTAGTGTSSKTETSPFGRNTSSGGENRNEPNTAPATRPCKLGAVRRRRSADRKARLNIIVLMEAVVSSATRVRPAQRILTTHCEDRAEDPDEPPSCPRLPSRPRTKPG